MNLFAIDWSTAILVGSIALLVSAVAWRMHVGAQKPTPAQPTPAPERNGIGQYRPQMHH
jgi:hypothetical protein